MVYNNRFNINPVMELVWNTSKKRLINPRHKDFDLVYKNPPQKIRIDSPYITLYLGLFPIGYLHLICPKNS